MEDRGRKEHKITTSVELVTPDRAREFLDKNTRNRPISVNAIREMTKAMRDGTFRFDGAPIRFSCDGVLLDGQHRLRAIVESGTSHQMVVVRGLPVDAFETMDIGTRRTGGQLLAIEKVTHYNMVSAVSRVVSAIESSSLTIRNHPTMQPNEVVRFVRSNPDVTEFVQATMNRASVFGKLRMPVIACLCAIGRISSKKSMVPDFVEGVLGGEGLRVGQAAHALRERLLRIRSDRRRESVGYICILIVRAWNAHARRQPYLRCQAGKDEERLPEIV